MLSSDRVRTSLRAAIHACDHTSLKTAISQLPTSLPQAEDPLEIASCLEQVRVAADVFIEACDSDTAFEQAINTRSALISAKLLPWTVSVLRNFAFEERVVSRVALTLSHLGTGAEPRGDIGAAGAVDELSILWKSHPSSIDIVHTLISLCGGHIDNISRFMRRRGITTAINVLNGPHAGPNTPLVERILLLVGICAICTPDNNRERCSLVPAILGTLKRQKRRPQTGVNRHAFIAVANMAECWNKEKDGYDLGDVHSLAELVVEKWISAPKCREMAFASSWALTALYGYNVNVLNHIKEKSYALGTLLERWRINMRTVRYLANLMGEANPETERGQKRSRVINKRIRTKTGKTVVADPGSDLDETGNEPQVADPDPERDTTDMESSPVSFEERSVESQTTISDSDSDDEPDNAVEPPKESTPKRNPRKRYSQPKQIPIIILDSDSDDLGSTPVEARASPRSKKEQSSPESIGTKTRRKNLRAKRSGQDFNDALTQVLTRRPNAVLEPNNDLDLRRSKRQRRPNPKYCSSPRKHGTRILKRTNIEPGPLLVSFPFIVPAHHDCQVLDSHQQ